MSSSSSSSSSSTFQGVLVHSLSLPSTVTTSSSSNGSIDGGGDVGPSKSSSSSSSSGNKTTNKKIVVPDWVDAYDPPPLIRSNIIWFWGLLLFGLAIIWPPLILLLTLVASKLIPYCYRITDDVSTRRQLLQEFETIDNDTSYRREIPDYVTLETNYLKNSRGLLLHTTIMIPSHMKEIKAIVGHCHAYTDNSTHTKRKELMHLVENGIAVLMIDYEGHGRSDGPLGLIQNWDVMTNDVHTYFQHILKSDSRLSNRNIFLLGESMGGAVAYSIIHEHPNDYAGVVFQAPMCKISKDMLPPNWVIDLLTTLIGDTPDAKTTVATKPNALGYLPVAPAKGDLRTLSFKLQEKRAICTRVPTAFGRRPRLATARELINITKRISDSLSEFNSPFLIQHGDLDRVTDPELSKALYKEAASQDKTLKLYEGMWHSLIAGEPDTNVLKVQNDATQWILERSSSSSNSSKSISSLSGDDDDDDHNGDAGAMTRRGLDGGRSQTKDSNERGDGNNNKGMFDWILDIGGNSNSSSSSSNNNKNEQKDDKKQK